MEERIRQELRQNREELSASSGQLNQSVLALTQMNEKKLEGVRDAVEKNLKSLQEDNSQKLEKIRVTVDEKLHETLDKRLGMAFANVQSHLEMVQKGLGEMQVLATGVGDLKRVLSNVKTRGILGEVQLGNLVEELFTPDQYEKNVATKKGSSDRVEYAIRMPGRDGERTLLPIDSKFPIECYERLSLCLERGDTASADACQKELVAHVKEEAKSIRNKYLDPPNTTDFGILFLPTEGLHAEILRVPGLSQLIQAQFQVAVAGPTTLAALLNSLHVGFRTLAITKRSNEVWGLLGTVKAEFSKFSQILEKTKKKLDEAANTIDDSLKKTRTIEKRLKSVQELPAESGTRVVDQGSDGEEFLAEPAPDSATEESR